MFTFKKITDCISTSARAGVMTMTRGTVNTPVFMPVGTLATVKSLSPQDLHECGAEIILSNTYHLYLRPGCEIIDRFSGVHRFMGGRFHQLTDVEDHFRIIPGLLDLRDEGAHGKERG